MKTKFRQYLGRLASPSLALYVLLFLAFYSFFAAWLSFYGDQLRALGGIAALLAPEHPFLTPVFLMAGGIFFVNTFACTVTRWPQINARWIGKAAGKTTSITGTTTQIDAFLRSEGFGGTGSRRYRFKFAFWGSWVMHVGLLFLIAGVLIERGFHDSGAFTLSQGQSGNLATMSVVFNREKGPLASETPPDVNVTLLAFDPERHQAGYAPDRYIRLQISDSLKTVEMTLDRAAGGEFDDLIFHPAIQTGIALNLNIPGQGVRAVHLVRSGEKTAQSQLVDLAGDPVIIGVDSARSLIDPKGTGKLAFWLQRQGKKQTLSVGEPFGFGSTDVVMLSPVRWAGFTYRRAAGVSAVWMGFAIILLGSFLMIFPAGLADLDETDGQIQARILVLRGHQVLQPAWKTFLLDNNRET